MTPEKLKLLEDIESAPGVWWKGYNAGKEGKSATECPYTPLKERLMNVWLSGFVTATEEGTLVPDCE